MENRYYMKSIEEIARTFGTELRTGLTEPEVAKGIEQFGFNELKEKTRETIFQKIIKQLKDFLILILIAASIVSGIVGDLSDSIVIIMIVIINAVLGVVQEGKAEKALEALKKMSAPNARVFRSGHVVIVPAKMLVPGDLVIIEAGDIIPADLRLIESVNLKLEEASLTGESHPVEKKSELIFEKEMGLGDCLNMAYMSTIVSYGRGRGIVVGTGTQTEIGKIAEAIQSYEEEMTPLQKKLNELGKILGIACIVICVLVFAIGFMKGEKILEMFLVAVSLAVAAIPEGLPAVVTIVLALGMKRMVHRNAIVRRLLAVETLGCVTVICTDKTGTLTQNEMTVTKVYTDFQEHKVTGIGYGPKGDFLSKSESLDKLLTAAVLCNDSILEENPVEKDTWGIVGDPTEGALLTAGAKNDFEKLSLNKMYDRIAEIPFDSERKMMTTFHENFLPGKIISFTKGAPDIILGKCRNITKGEFTSTIAQEDLENILDVNNSFACDALRVLAFAYKEYDRLPENLDAVTIEKDMTFIGLMGMIDPARLEAYDAINLCKAAGIRPVMITGDHKGTAVAIAEDLGLLAESTEVMNGSELDTMSQEEFGKHVDNISVYARVSPDHKVRIVEMLREKGHVVAMTGDGVNDAMALKRADIGVSMGITGTDVAKGTADIILMDDNFATIVAAVEEGRIIYGNIRKFVFFLLSCNIAEILIIFLSILASLPVPLVPIQLLWLNLVSDSFPALALGMEKGEPGIMEQKPRNTSESIINKSMVFAVLILSLTQTFSVLFGYIFVYQRTGDLTYARTIAFATIILTELLMAYTCRSERIGLLRLGVFSNKTLLGATVLSLSLLLAVLYIPVLHPIFKTISLSIQDWGFILSLSIIPLISMEIYKKVVHVFKKAGSRF